MLAPLPPAAAPFFGLDRLFRVTGDDHRLGRCRLGGGFPQTSAGASWAPSARADSGLRLGRFGRAFGQPLPAPVRLRLPLSAFLRRGSRLRLGFASASASGSA